MGSGGGRRDGLPLDGDAQRPEPLVDPLVAALDLADVVDGARPLRARAAMTIAMPARMSGLPGRAAQLAGPETTARWGSQRTIRAPMPMSLSTKNMRLSNIFSKIRTVPSAWVAITMAIDIRSAGKAGPGRVVDLGRCRRPGR